MPVMPTPTERTATTHARRPRAHDQPRAPGRRPAPPRAAVDAPIAAALGLLALATDLPMRTRMLYAWDSVLFARALDHFDVVAHQPQPPGYLFTVLGARLLRWLGGLSANDAYVWLSLLAAAGCVAVLYLVGAALFGRAVGLVAALLAITSVAFSVYAGVAYPYTLLALGSALLGGLCWGVRQGRLPAWAAGLALGLLAGFRQDLLLLLGPLLLVSVGGRPFGRLVGAGVAVGLGGLTWLLPSAGLSGGLPAYLGALTSQAADVERDTSIVARGLPALLENLRLLLRYSLNTLYLAIVPLALWLAVRVATPAGRRDPRLVHLVVWAGPGLLVYSLLHLGEIGYVLSIMPPAWLAAAAGLHWLAARLANVARRPAAAPALLALLASLPVGFNLWWSLLSDRPLSAHWLRCKDAGLAAAVATVATFDPANTAIVTSGHYEHARYYLPAYPVIFHDPYRERTTRQAVPPDIRQVIVLDWALPAAPNASSRRLPLPCGEALTRYEVAPGATVEVGAAGIAVTP